MAISVLAFLVLTVWYPLSVRGDVSLASYTTFNYSSGSGNSGTLSLLNTYIFTDPVSVTSQNVFFNLTGKTASATALPSYQLAFQAWGTAGTGIVPVVVESGSVRPTYILNVANYSYVNPDITLYMQNANSTVTISFEAFAGNYLYSATAPVTAASWDGASRTYSFTASTGTFNLYTPFDSITQVRKNGVIIAENSEWAVNRVGHVVTVTSTSTGVWEIAFGTGGGGGGGGSGGYVGIISATTSSTTVAYPPGHFAIVGSITLSTTWSLPPHTYASFDLSVPNPSGVAVTVTIKYGLRDMNGSMLIAQTLTSNQPASITHTYTLQLEVPKPGRFTFQADVVTSTTPTPVSATQDFTVSIGQFYGTTIAILLPLLVITALIYYKVYKPRQLYGSTW